MALGDVIAQFAVERKKLVNWDIGRTGRFLAFGTLAMVKHFDTLNYISETFDRLINPS